jgi:hypothetical protein
MGTDLCHTVKKVRKLSKEMDLAKSGINLQLGLIATAHSAPFATFLLLHTVIGKGVNK